MDDIGKHYEHLCRPINYRDIFVSPASVIPRIRIDLFMLVLPPHPPLSLSSPSCAHFALSLSLCERAACAHNASFVRTFVPTRPLRHVVCLLWSAGVASHRVASQVFSKGDEYLTTLEDGTMISGWDTGLAGLRKGDRALIRYIFPTFVGSI